MAIYNITSRRQEYGGSMKCRTRKRLLRRMQMRIAPYLCQGASMTCIWGSSRRFNLNIYMKCQSYQHNQKRFINGQDEPYHDCCGSLVRMFERYNLIGIADTGINSGYRTYSTRMSFGRLVLMESEVDGYGMYGNHSKDFIKAVLPVRTISRISPCTSRSSQGEVQFVPP